MDLLLERDDERRGLSKAIEQALGGNAGFVVVDGQAGIGKTALLKAVRAEAVAAGMTVFAARGSELETKHAFGAAQQWFEPVVARVRPAQRAELFAGAGSAAAQLFEPAGGALESREDVSFALLHGLYWLAADLCTEQPALITLDDLQWCDGPTLRFLAYLLPRLEGLSLLVVVTLRSGAPTVDQHLVDRILTDPVVTVLRPAPLSAAASAELVSGLCGDADSEFHASCYSGSGGNPLLLRALADVAVAEHLPLTPAGGVQLLELAPRAVSRRVRLRLAQVGPAATRLARAVAVLVQADPALAAKVSGLPPAEVTETVSRMVSVELLHPEVPLRFVHPLVQAAVYDSITPSDKAAEHRCAARALYDAGADPEAIAAHLLRTNPPGELFNLATLRLAAQRAAQRGSPADAVTFLERALAEPLGTAERCEILRELGPVALSVNTDKAIQYLRESVTLTTDPAERATLADQLGRALLYQLRIGEAIDVWESAVDELGDQHAAQRQQLEAALVYGTGYFDSQYMSAAMTRLDKLRHVDPAPGLGGRFLDTVIAYADTVSGINRQDAAERANRALSDPTLITVAPEVWNMAMLVPANTDLELARSKADEGMARAHTHGSFTVLTSATAWSGITNLLCGALAGADADFRVLMEMTDTARLLTNRACAGWIAEALIEQGRLDEASNAIDWGCPDGVVPDIGRWEYFLYGRGLLELAQGKVDRAVETLFECGRRAQRVGHDHPAVLAGWRSPAALGLHRLGRVSEAEALASENLELASTWGEPRILGNALRVAGQVSGGQAGLQLLQDSVATLTNTPACLEYAKSLVELGAALRRAGRRAAARTHLQRGLDLAHQCGAMPLTEQARAELRAAGARPRSTAITGPEALTPSEKRVAELAATGQTNRDIAQHLFVTTKTVEVHLSSTYRKLGIIGRNQLHNQLTKK